MALNRCVTKDYGYIGCGSDVIDIAHAFCSGRRSCEIPVPNSLMDAQASCPDDFKSYLSVNYECRSGTLDSTMGEFLLGRAGPSRN